MKKITWYLIIVVLVGSAIVGYWIYERYLLKPEVQVLFFNVTRGPLQDIITARGVAEATTSFDLELPYSGTVILVKGMDGRQVKEGDVLMSLDASDLALERTRLDAVKLQADAKLAKLIAGPSENQVRVADEKVVSASALFEDARKVLSDRIRDAFINSDDAIRSKTDLFFESPRFNPKFIYEVYNQQTKADVENSRKTIEIMLNSWGDSITGIDAINLIAKSAEAQRNVAQVSYYLDKVVLLITSLTTSQTMTQTVLDTFKANLALARDNVAGASSSIISGVEKLNTAEAALRVTQREAESAKSPSRSEDLALARASVSEAVSQIAAVEEKIRKSVLASPTDGTISKMWFERGEFYNIGQPAVSLSSTGYKIQSDVSELDIRKINSTGGEDVVVTLDAYPGEKFSGKVTLIESRPVIKDSDVYYRVIIILSESKDEIRSGMSADITIYGLKKDEVLKVPELAVYKRGQEKFVYMSPDVGGVEQVVVTGISDGVDIEVVSGLDEGDKIYVKPE